MGEGKTAFVYTCRMSELPVTQINLPPGFIDLGMGNPGLDLLPLDMLHRASENCFAAGDARFLQYGVEQGDGYFRAALAGFISKQYMAHVDPAWLFVTAGASSALDLLCTLHTQPGDVVFIEEPTYFLALRIFADHGLQIIPIPLDEDGLMIDALEEMLKEITPKFVYTIPTFQNPSGWTLSQARREKLVELSKEHDFLILADEVYHFLPYTEAPPQPFALYTETAENVISVNSFSKILAPGLRLGWVQAHPRRIRELTGCGLLDSGGGMNPFTSAVVRGVIESGDLNGNIDTLRRVYARRLQAMDAALRRYLPRAEYALPAGGFFFWVRIPGIDAADLREPAKRAGIDFRPGCLFSGPGALKDHIRLSFCFYDERQIENGLLRLKGLLS